VLFTYPKQSVLVLGRELIGIPVEIAGLCDAAIAIPQFGMVESLNVQTAAAIAIYEYGRQYPLTEVD
jgi:tRNA G18 (ribose-2'-O)-methylase SpoU